MIMQRKINILKDSDANLAGEDIREGLYSYYQY